MPQPTTVMRIPLGFGDHGVYRTIQLMAQLIQEGSVDPYVRNAAQTALLGVAPYDTKGEVQAIFRYVKEQVRYTKDPEGHEYVQTPQLMILGIEQMQGSVLGDCDDMIVLCLTLLRSIGYAVALRITAYGSGSGAQEFGGSADFGHVYGMVAMPRPTGGHVWVIVDPIRPEFVVGTEGPGAAPSRYRDLVIGEAEPVWLMLLADGIL